MYVFGDIFCVCGDILYVYGGTLYVCDGILCVWWWIDSEYLTSKTFTGRDSHEGHWGYCITNSSPQFSDKCLLVVEPNNTHLFDRNIFSSIQNIYRDKKISVSDWVAMCLIWKRLFHDYQIRLLFPTLLTFILCIQ